MKKLVGRKLDILLISRDYFEIVNKTWLPSGATKIEGKTACRAKWVRAKMFNNAISCNILWEIGKYIEAIKLWQ